jgi:hypothetical protein
LEKLVSSSYHELEPKPLQYSAELHYFDQLPLREWPQQWHPTPEFPTPQSVGSDEFGKVINDALLFDKEPSFYRIGHPEHAIAVFRNYFIEAYDNNQVIIVDAETGSGKSTGIPLALLEEYLKRGDDRRLIVTSPRILPTLKLLQWTRMAVGPDLAHLIGNQTGKAEESDCPPTARVIFATEHLVMKELTRGKLNPRDDIMLDEAHERSKYMTTMKGLLKRALPNNPDRHIFVTSATIDTKPLAEHFIDPKTGKPAIVLKLPGRNYPVEFIISNRSVAEAAADYIRQGNNVIVNEPGITRMQNTASKIAYIKRAGDAPLKDHHVHLLYGDQSPREQEEALNPADGHHIVGNKIVETSLTPDGKNVVVGGGLSNVGRYNQGVRILKTVHSSKATIEQQGGRVGRTGPGIQELALPDNAPPIAYEDRDEYDLPEIQSSSVTSLIAECLIAETLGTGERLENLSLDDQPNPENLRHDYKVLRRLGATAVVNEVEVLTDIGWQMAELPLDMPHARMVVEARNTEDAEGVHGEAVHLQACAIAAIQQVNGILEAWKNGKRRDQLSLRWKAGLSEERRSDVLYELDAFIALRRMQNQMGAEDGDVSFERLLRRKGAKINPYYKAKRTFNELCRREDLDLDLLAKPTDQERTRLIECQITGAEELFVQRNHQRHLDIRGSLSRRLGVRSTIDPWAARLVIGTAFDLEGMTDKGTFTRRYIHGASAVTTEQLLANAPHRITRKSLGYGVTRQDELRERQALYFDGSLMFDVMPVEPSPSIETRGILINAMMKGIKMPSFDKDDRFVPFAIDTPNASRARHYWRKAQDIEHRTPHKLAVDERYQSLVNKIVRESVEKIPLTVTDPSELDSLIPKVNPHRLVRPKQRKRINEIIKRAPDMITILIDEDREEQLSVAYRFGVARVSVPTHLRFKIKREHLKELETHHNVKLRVGSGQYQHLDTAFKVLAEKYVEHLKRQERRATEARAQSFSSETPVGKQRRTKNDMQDLATEPSKPQLKPWIKKRVRNKSKDIRQEVRSERRRARRNNWEAVLVD